MNVTLLNDTLTNGTSNGLMNKLFDDWLNISQLLEILVQFLFPPCGFLLLILFLIMVNNFLTGYFKSKLDKFTPDGFHLWEIPFKYKYYLLHLKNLELKRNSYKNLIISRLLFLIFITILCLSLFFYFFIRELSLIITTLAIVLTGLIWVLSSLCNRYITGVGMLIWNDIQYYERCRLEKEKTIIYKDALFLSLSFSYSYFYDLERMEIIAIPTDVLAGYSIGRPHCVDKDPFK